MKSKFGQNVLQMLILVFVVFSFADGIAQEKTKKELKEERKLEKQKKIALLVESKEFVFEVNRVIPQGGRTVNVTTYYSVEFHPNLINSHLPFFGRGLSGIGYGGDDGMSFEGEPSVFTIETTKKGFDLKAVVKGKNDVFNLLFNVYSEGNAFLTITSNNRSPISYDGDIRAYEKK